MSHFARLHARERHSSSSFVVVLDTWPVSRSPFSAARGGEARAEAAGGGSSLQRSFVFLTGKLLKPEAPPLHLYTYIHTRRDGRVKRGRGKKEGLGAVAD